MIKVILILLFITAISCTDNIDKATKAEPTRLNKAKTAQDNFPDGPFVQKHPNGEILIKGNVLNNKREGLWVAYYPTGIKQSESTYQSGVLHGRTASFYKNGQVRYIGYFYGDKKEGKWDFYSEDGEFEKSEEYVKGELAK